MDCIFCKIAKGEIPSSKIYEDDNYLAFLDINPVAHGHTLVIPKIHTADIFDTPESVFSGLTAIAKKIAKAVVCATAAEGVNFSINNGAAAGQAVFHIHIHLIPRKVADNLPPWPHGRYASGEAEKIAEDIRRKLS